LQHLVGLYDELRRRRLRGELRKLGYLLDDLQRGRRRHDVQPESLRLRSDCLLTPLATHKSRATLKTSQDRGC
jgi:hypothetical protein